MKLVRYGRAGKEKPGLIDGAGKLRDLSEVVADIDGATLDPRSLSRIAKIKPESLPAVRGAPRIGPCVGHVGNFVAVGLNYADHAAESGMAVPKEPVLFTKAPSCIVGPNDDVIIPKGSTKTDWEVELAIVIGARASYVAEAQALSHVAGYCICNDVSEREFQLERSGQWVKGKSAPTFGPLGPWLVTPDEIRRRAKARSLAGRERRAHADRLDRDDGLRRQATRLLYLAFHDPRARGRHYDRDAPRGRLGQEAAALSQAGRHDVARRRRARAPGAARAGVEGGRLDVKGLRSWTGLVFAVVYAGVFAALYIDYLRRAGAWFADLPLVLAALPFTLVMRALSGGSYDFAGDMTLRVIGAVLFCCAVAYIAGLILEVAVRAMVRMTQTLTR